VNQLVHSRLQSLLGAGEAQITLSEVADGAEALALAEVARVRFKAGVDAPALAVFVARDGMRAGTVEAALSFFAPEIEVLSLPAWDTQPYDRASPNAPVVARRMMTLSRLVRSRGGDRPRVVVTTVNALLQRLPPIAWVSTESLSAAPGNAVDIGDLTRWMEVNGFSRASTVRDIGEYAVRGGIVDLYPAGPSGPIRIDLFGDVVETIKGFDPETQRSTHPIASLDLVPMTEFQLTTESIKRFRQRYVATFGAPTRGDVLYESISEGRRFPGMEHWLPLFHERMETLEAYLPGAVFLLDHQTNDAAEERLRQVSDYQEARQNALEAGTAGGAPYKPLPKDSLYLTPGEWAGLRDAKTTLHLTPFALPDGGQRFVASLGAKTGHSFAAVRADENANVFDAVVQHIRSLQKAGRRVIVASFTEGARSRNAGVLDDHGLKNAKPVRSLREAMELNVSEPALAVLGVEQGFETADFAVISEQDILGERLSRPQRSNKRAKDFISEVASLSAGDVIVHVDHGIGRFVGLKTIDVSGAPHDCLEIHYHGGDKLFLPVENIELLSRYGSEDTEVQLDRLGGTAWQARKARLKKRIRDMAKALIKIAAARMMREAPAFPTPAHAYDEFVARFPYTETDDQQDAIDAVLADLDKGKPMDRLICGDVGFGKTEVALRAAFVAAMAGKQVAVVVPTTLLARQHYRTFADRFKGLPIRIAQASRLVSSGDLKKTKDELAAGTLDIVVGTHALLGKTIKFKDLGLLIVDEEQHFGVAHKERLKDLRAEVHVLTLSATPIPRTLQLALTGVRELSIIATPPVDRLAVRTFITPFDELVVREALLRERFRGGQSFYVCPRIEDIAEVKAFLDSHVPEVRVGIGHGQMAAGDLEQVMSDFYDGKFDVLLSTTIVESGLDIPRANTLIVHRADMFGLAALYQLRGRVGRSKTRAYAIFTVPVKKPVSATAERRLKVLQSLDSLGAGFQLASHDLDIRGAGNLLGEEQSGHIREVGFELYQQMIEEAVAALKAGIEEEEEEQWSPTIAIGAPVLIPEHYIADLDLRMGLYKRLSTLETDQAIEGFAAELIDRFGPLPSEVEQLMKIVAIKALCRRANIGKVEAGPRGIIVAFRDNSFANPNGLVRYVTERSATTKVRPDMRVVFQGDFEKVDIRLTQTRRLLGELVRIAEGKGAR
jgi:transcription-repair coupling factor (superfamily II helicase)